MVCRTHRRSCVKHSGLESAADRNGELAPSKSCLFVLAQLSFKSVDSRAHHLGIAAEASPHDASCPSWQSERSFPDNPSSRPKQHVSHLGHAPSNNNQLRIEDIDQVGQPDAQVIGCFGHYLTGYRVPQRGKTWTSLTTLLLLKVINCKMTEDSRSHKEVVTTLRACSATPTNPE